jgi:hypothetical protein
MVPDKRFFLHFANQARWLPKESNIGLSREELVLVLRLCFPEIADALKLEHDPWILFPTDESI